MGISQRANVRQAGMVLHAAALTSNDAVLPPALMAWHALVVKPLVASNLLHELSE